MVALLVPVGHSVGPLFTMTGEQEPDSYDIRFGDGIFSVDKEELRIWSAAHGDPRRVTQELPSREMISRSAADMPEKMVNEIIDRLRDVGLLVEFEQKTTQAQGFAYRHQIFPLAIGLGNTVEKPWYFQIGLPQIPRLIVAEDVYHLWMFAHRHPSLWEACVYVGLDRQELAASRPGIETDPDKILAHFIDAVPAMLATSCAYVDRVR